MSQIRHFPSAPSDAATSSASFASIDGANRAEDFAASRWERNSEQTKRVLLMWIGGTALLATLQFLSGTDPLFITFIGIFVLLTGMTIHALGGIHTLPGVCVAVLAAQHIIISQIGKILFWQPAQSNLHVPIITAAAYALAMFSMLAGAYAARCFGYGRGKPLLRVPLQTNKLFWFSVLCILFSLTRKVIIVYFGGDTVDINVGGILGPLRTMTFLDSLAIASSTAYVINKSNRKVCFGWLNAIPIAMTVVFGIVGAGRTDMATGIVTLLVTCWVMDFPLRFKHFATLTLLGVIAQFILFPYALYARNFVRTGDFGRNMSLAMGMVIDSLNNPAQYQEQSKKIWRQRYLYYGQPVPTLDRYSLIISADAIIEAAQKRGTTEMEMITPGFAMLLPRFILPDKPVFSTSNALAHRADSMVLDSDFTTQITLGFVCDAFTAFDWMGVLIIPFLLIFMLSLIYSKVMGAYIKGNVLAAAVLFITSWNFSGYPISSNILIIMQTPMVLVFTFSIILYLTNELHSLTSQDQRIRS